jgi:hypothetical protein
MVRQAEADGAQGYDFVAYHGYGKRRYFELVGRKCDALHLLLCAMPPRLCSSSMCVYMT